MLPWMLTMTAMLPRLRTVASGAVTDPTASGPTLPPADELEWVVPLEISSDHAMSERGLARVRTILQMRCELPLAAGVTASVRKIKTEAFDPITDSAGFLDVNNRAFWWHPDQGGWDQKRLMGELQGDWVDLGGFLVHRDDTSRIDGYCWTRVHAPSADEDEPALGEIYAIAADPHCHGRGLGKALVVAGLGHLHSEDLDHGILYVEQDNEAAVQMYLKLGFHVHERRGGYR